MTGKEFFGKLLSNRQNTPEPWDRDDSGDGRAAAELDVAPTYYEEADAADVAGGDGQSSPLPEVRPSSPQSTDIEAHPETPDSSTAAEPPIQQLTSAEPPANYTETHDSEASADLEYPSLAPAANGRYADEEVPAAPPSSNGRHTDKELPAAPSMSNGRYADKELPAAPSPSNGRHADEELPAAPSNDRDIGKDLPPAPPVGDNKHVIEDLPEAPPPNNGKKATAAGAAAPAAQNGRKEDADRTAATPPRSDGTRADASSGAARASTTARSSDASPNGAPLPAKDRPADTPPPPAEPSQGTPPPAEPSQGTPPPAGPPRGTPPARKRAAAGPAQRAEQPQNRVRPDAQAPTPRRVVDRKEPDSSKRRSNGPSSMDGDAELKGIKDRVVLRLLQKTLVSETHVKAALRERNKDNLKATLWRIVAHQHGVDREAIYREAALTYAFVERKLEEKDVDLEFVRQVADVFPEKRRNRLIELRVVPVGYEFEQQTQMLRVVFLTHDPSLPAVRELMQELNLERYELQYAPELVVKDLLAKAFPRKNEYLERMSEDPLAYDLGMSYEEDKGELIDEEALEAEINRSSLINLFEAALVESVHKGASDIHIYPNAKRQVEIHFRIDGRLMLWHLEDKVHPESLLAVIKDNSMNVDRFERDMAQDGFIQRKVDDTLIRYRVSIMPIATAQQSMHAESIVIRVLDDRKVLTDLSQLGLLKGAIERFDMAIRQPHGMVILTGPTGSGKSTTLVAALHQVVNPEINVLTVEDPVEYIIPSVRQIKLNHKLNLEQALRSILRHDPDVVMVGEMRDRPTAELAIKLANTGHLTFSTLHTNDAPSAVSRLYKMGVEPFLIAYAINLVVAQRLIRSLCPTCKIVDGDPDPVLLDRFGFTKDDLATTTLYKASGDPTCKTCKGIGYKGRRAISEALYFSRAIRHLVVEADTKIDEDALREAARKEGMLTLQDSAREVVKMGATSVDEMMRVTATED